MNKINNCKKTKDANLKKAFIDTTNLYYEASIKLTKKTNDFDYLKQEYEIVNNKLISKMEEIEKVKEENKALALLLSNNTNAIESLKFENDELMKEKESCKLIIDNKTVENESLINGQNEVRKFLFDLSNTKIYRLAHFITRLKQQGIRGGELERKNFVKWLAGSSEQKINHQYNPLFTAMNLLKCKNCDLTKNSNENAVSIINEEKKDDLSLILNQEYKKLDIIILGIIDYDFRFQRPQHFAKRLAKMGHRVFYINANFSNNFSINKIEDNLFVVTLSNTKLSIHETDLANCIGDSQEEMDKFIFDYGITDACLLVDYPNWINIVKFLKNKYFFKTITDYMDDFGGFINPVAETVKTNCFELLKISDKVIASSEYLYDCACGYNENVTIIRNATEYEYFHKAYNDKNNRKKEEKIIGYYGAISTWFDMNIVCECAKRFPKNKIILIGEITCEDESYKKYDNIITMGEKPYNELTKHLEDFNVCIIPFDTSTSLIKATNPVKFYEYLSAGKKIVATEIPELEPYRNQYVYLENDPNEFCKKIDLCLNDEDNLYSCEARFEFAKANDWDQRCNQLIKNINKLYKKVSIILLCYNNLDLTKKCVDSIINNTAYPNYELIIVDNNSIDGTPEFLKELKEKNNGIKLVLNKQNRGFAGGNNDGLKIANGDYLVLLNNDTEVTRGWLSTLLNHLENDKTLGMIGPVTNAIGNEAKIFTSYTEMQQMKRFAFEYRKKHLNEVYTGIKVLAMFCLMMRREVFEKVGFLDEKYGIGMFEDDDYSESAKKNGFSIALAEDVYIHHGESESFKKLEQKEKAKIFNNNRKYFENKWNKKWIRHKYRNLFDSNNSEWIKAYLDNSNKNNPSNLCQHLLSQYELYDSLNGANSEFEKILRENNGKKIIVYPRVIDWIPFQTPQYLLEAFAKRGYFCIFCYSNLNNKIEILEKNIIGVNEKTFLECIGDRECTVLLTWVGSIAFINKIKNKKVWYHILDKLSIFAMYDYAYEYLNLLLVDSADILSYVSKPLEKYLNGNSGVYLPNAANYDEIISEKEDSFVPVDMDDILKKEKDIIGYFGWISRWFDFETVFKIATKNKNISFVLIGPIDVYDDYVKRGVDRLKELKNIHFLGEKNHKELPNYAKFFSICIIPFLINDEMDCVSPIKFYEYCAYGKPIICSEMPEIKKYENSFIKCYKNETELNKLIRKFLNPKIKNKATKEAIFIAKNNSWESRALEIEKYL